MIKKFFKWITSTRYGNLLKAMENVRDDKSLNPTEKLKKMDKLLEDF